MLGKYFQLFKRSRDSLSRLVPTAWTVHSVITGGKDGFLVCVY